MRDSLDRKGKNEVPRGCETRTRTLETNCKTRAILDFRILGDECFSVVTFNWQNKQNCRSCFWFFKDTVLQ